MSNNAVVITGIGMVTPLGAGREKNWEKLLYGKSAVRSSSNQGFLTARADFISGEHHTRALQLAFLATLEALQDSKLEVKSIEPQRLGLTVSVSKQILIDKAGQNLFSPEVMFQSNLGGQLANVFNIRGPRRNVVAACSTGTHSCLLGAQWIRWGLCDAVVCGASESSFHPLYVAGFKNMGVLARGAVRPFDTKREGFAMSEGSGVLVLENKANALLRGAKIYAEVSGWASSADAASQVAMSGDGSKVSASIIQAAKMACIDFPDYINAHGTATNINDRIETLAIKRAFKKNAYKLSVSSIKASTGHMLGACGAVELGITALTLRDNVMPPTLNLENPDPELDLDYVPSKAREKSITSAMSLSLGFGGQIGAIVLKKLC
jgi:3-oxoacyl-[acyl-carrier-protein] synthase II